MFNHFHSAPLKTKKLRLNIHWFFKLQFSLYGLAIASLAQVIQTPDSKLTEQEEQKTINALLTMHIYLYQNSSVKHITFSNSTTLLFQLLNHLFDVQLVLQFARLAAFVRQVTRSAGKHTNKVISLDPMLPAELRLLLPFVH